MSHKRAFSLIEVMVAMSVGAFIIVITTMALRNASSIFTKTSGRDGAYRDLAKARRNLELDLTQVSLNRFVVAPAPASLGGGSDGDAIDFLSAVNVTDGKVAVLADGSGGPYYFRNIVYYLTVPTDHNTLFATTCTGGNEGGYDYNCPHKLLMRLVVDQNPAFDPSDSATQDTLLPGLNAFLARPTGFPKAANGYVAGVNLLSFRVTPRPGELEIDLRAVAVSEARRKQAVGTSSLRIGPYTIEQHFSVFPKN